MYIYFVYFAIVRFGVLKQGSNNFSVLLRHEPNETFVVPDLCIRTVTLVLTRL